MRVVTHLFNGTGATLYISLGMIPHHVELYALDDTDLAHSVWDGGMRAPETVEGILKVEASNDFQGTPHTYNLGIQPYEGGDDVTAANQPIVTFGEGIYLRDGQHGDERNIYADGGSAASQVIDTWTLGSSANRTGNFNDDIHASSTHVGKGSKIIIRGTDRKRYETGIEALAAGAGVTANEVTLNRPIPSGKVLFIGPRYSLEPHLVGEVTRAGIKISTTSLVNVNDQLQMLKVWLDD